MSMIEIGWGGGVLKEEVEEEVFHHSSTPHRAPPAVRSVNVSVCGCVCVHAECSITGPPASF